MTLHQQFSEKKNSSSSQLINRFSIIVFKKTLVPKLFISLDAEKAYIETYGN